jgi:hypothetical protein
VPGLGLSKAQRPGEDSVFFFFFFFFFLPSGSHCLGMKEPVPDIPTCVIRPGAQGEVKAQHRALWMAAWWRGYRTWGFEI